MTPRALALVPLLVTLAPGCGAADPCAQAAREFEAGRAAEDLDVRLEAFSRAATRCPNFQSFYQLGVTHLSLQRPAEAKRALVTARTHVEAGSRWQAYLEGRVAEAHMALEEVPRALVAVERAFTILDENGASPPAWLVAVRRAVDDRTADLSAAELAAGLRGLRFAAEPRIHLQVNFDFDSAALTARGERQARALAEALTEYAATHRMLVIGHTDSVGEDAYNQQLSERRARSVVSAVRRAEPELAGRLEARGLGETEPRYANTTDADRARNRRVEVRLVRP